MSIIRRIGKTFSNLYRFRDTMTNMYYNYDGYIEITDYKLKIKNTFMCNSRNSKIMSDIKKLSLEDKISDYKLFQKSYERWCHNS